MDGLIPVCNATESLIADANTIQSENISGVDLMERASGNVYRQLVKKLNPSDNIAVMCGPGNNGGDGWCIARFLAADGFNVKGYDSCFNGNYSTECEINLEFFKSYKPDAFHNAAGQIDFGNTDVIIDALFGSGLSKPLSGEYESLVEAINKANCRIYSVDIPSGLYSDNPQNNAPFVHATESFAIQTPFPSFFYPENRVNFSVVNAGIQNPNTGSWFLSPQQPWKDQILRSIPKKDQFGHKGTFGHIAIAGGNQGMHGAAAIAATAAHQHGAGLTTVIAPESASAYLGQLPGVMHVHSALNQQSAESVALDKFTVLCVGPGLGATNDSLKFLKILLRKWNKPIILDADGLNLLATDHSLWEYILPDSIITPHPGEFRRLFGDFKTGKEAIKRCRDKATEKGIYIVLKGHYSVLACPNGDLYYNGTGDATLARGGSGDYLSGAISAWCGRPGHKTESILAAMYLSGLQTTVI